MGFALRPLASRNLSIILADWMEHIERFHGRVASDGAVSDAARNSPHLAGLHRLGLTADREGQLSLQQHSHLLVRMTVRLDNRVGLKLDQREHHLLPGTGEDLNAAEYLVVRA